MVVMVIRAPRHIFPTGKKSYAMWLGMMPPPPGAGLELELVLGAGGPASSYPVNSALKNAPPPLPCLPEISAPLIQEARSTYRFPHQNKATHTRIKPLALAFATAVK